MRKLYSSLLLLGLLLVACSSVSTPSVVVTEVQPTVTPFSTDIPSMNTPVLLKEITLETKTGTAYSLDWSPDGETLAAACGVEIILLSNNLEEVRATLTPSSGALTATWSADERQLATVVGFRNSTITLWDWDAASAEITIFKEISGGVDQYGASWSPDGKLLATLANDRKSTIQIWDTNTWELLNKYDLPYANPRRALNWSADSKTLYDAGELNSQVVAFGLNVEDGTVHEFAKLPTEQVYAFGVSPDSTTFAAADESGKVQIFELSSGILLTEFQSVSEPVSLAWNPQQATVAVLGYKTGLQLWDVSP